LLTIFISLTSPYVDIVLSIFSQVLLVISSTYLATSATNFDKALVLMARQHIL